MEAKIHGWNDAIENTIKFIGESAQAYKMMHLLSAKQYSWLYNFLMYASLILSPAAGTLATVETALQGDYGMYFSITVAVISFLVTVVTGVIKFGSFHEKSESHKIATSKYTSLESNVRRQLQLYREDRIPAPEYYEWLDKSFDDLFRGAPFIDDRIYRKYYKLSIQKGLVFPNRYDNFITIERGWCDKLICDIENQADIEVTGSLPARHPEGASGLRPPGAGDESPEREGKKEGAGGETVPEAGGARDLEIGSRVRFHAPITAQNSGTFSTGSRMSIYPRRKSVHTPIADLNRYGEGQMNYELRRFMNF